MHAMVVRGNDTEHDLFFLRLTVSG